MTNPDKNKPLSAEELFKLLDTSSNNSTNIEEDFKPEVLGRLDAILTYKSLDQSIMKNLIDRQVKMLNQRLVGKNLHIVLDDLLYQEIAKRGYDPRFGARPLQSVFGQFITRPLSRKLLAGELGSGELQAHWTEDQNNHLIFQ